MRFLTLFLILIAIQNVHAWTLKEVAGRDGQNQLVRSYVAQCESGEAFCQSLCGSDRCVVSQDSCNACVTDTSLLVRSFLLDADRIYSTKYLYFTDKSLATYLKREKFFIFSINSVLNTFTDPRAPEEDAPILAALSGLCLFPTKNPMILMSGGGPENWKPIGIFCEDIEEHQSLVQPLGPNEDYGLSNGREEISNLGLSTSIYQRTPLVHGKSKRL